MKTTRLIAGWLIALMSMAGCGGTPAKAPPPPTTKLAKRVLVSNEQASAVQILDGTKDLIATSISVGSKPTQMIALSGQTLVFNSGDNTVSIIDNAKESEGSRIQLPEFAESLVATSDGKTAYSIGRAAGTVFAADISSRAVTSICPAANPACLPGSRRLVLSHNGAKLLVFSDDSDSINVVNASSADKTPVPVGGFDRPVFGVFSGDDSKAFILSCGSECGGTAAKVTVFDVGSNTIVGAPITVSGATIGLLDGTQLYVAGTTGGGGVLDVIDTGSLTVTSARVAIGDGFHHLMALGPNGKLFIGARTCTNNANPAVPSQGCLSIFNTSAKTAVVPVLPAGTPRGDVTGIQAISSRSVVYVCEAGEVQIYDTSTNGLQSKQLDILGQAIDVKEIK